jgi:hypothetical protein
VKLTPAQLRALRFYAGTRAQRTAPGSPLGGLPRWDVSCRLRDAGLIEYSHDPSVSFDMVSTDAGRRLLAEIDAALPHDGGGQR